VLAFAGGAILTLVGLATTLGFGLAFALTTLE
jgi:hypothetical protein